MIRGGKNKQLGYDHLPLSFLHCRPQLIPQRGIETYRMFVKVRHQAGLHNSFHPTIRDGSTWSKFGAREEHGDVFLFSNLSALTFVDV